MTDPLEVADLLDKAHDELLHDGWGQRHFQSPNTGSLCSLGALGKAAGVHPATALLCDAVRRAIVALADTVNPSYFIPSSAVMLWNDEPGRTEDEVFDAFRQTSKRLRDEAGQ